MKDVLVVGAGPSGSYLSYRLSKLGYDVLNLEEHREVGKPVECTGLVSERVFSYVRSKAKVNTVSGANIYFPNGKKIHVEKSERTIVMDRDSFDKDVAAMSIGAGTDLRIGSKVLEVRVNNDEASVKYRENGQIKEEKGKIVVGADGVNSRVRKDLHDVRPKRIISAYQVDSAVKMPDQDSVDVYLGSESTNGFFGWATPSGELSRIGVGVYKSSAIKYFKKINERFPKDRIIGINGGGIPIAYLKKTYGYRNLLVGDAAGIVKPLTGGGIYTGIVSANHGANAIDYAFENEDFSEKTLRLYQKGWKKELGRELWFDGVVQRYFAKISDQHFNRIYDVVSNSGVIDLINNTGDIDYPSRVIFSVLIRNPSLLKYIFTRSK